MLETGCNARTIRVHPGGNRWQLLFILSKQSRVYTRVQDANRKLENGSGKRKRILVKVIYVHPKPVVSFIWRP